MPSKEYLESLEALNKVKPQIRVPIVPGMSVRKKKDSYDTIPVIRIHYSADPDRDPKTKTGQLWRKKKRGEYSSQADWDREMEIIDGAGGGERIYAEILSTHFKKIVITDPTWQPGKTWKLISGFDYGKTNPTSALDARVDHDGKIYFVGEYYQPGKDIGGHAPTLLGWNAFMACEDVMCDPSIFNKTMEQRDTKKAISVADIYYECGITNLRPFIGNRSDIAFEQRLKMHWNNLDEKEPTIRIWCPGLTEIPDRPVYGQHDGCPSLLWEMSNIRRVKLTATQLMTQNPSEQIVDKDNHAHDAKKYIVMTLPEPTAKTTEQRIQEAIKDRVEVGDVTNAMRIAQDVRQQIAEEEEPASFANRFAVNEPTSFKPARMGSRFGGRRR